MPCTHFPWHLELPDYEISCKDKEHKKGHRPFSTRPPVVVLMLRHFCSLSFIEIGGPIETNWTEVGGGAERGDVHENGEKRGLIHKLNQENTVEDRNILEWNKTFFEPSFGLIQHFMRRSFLIYVSYEN